MPDEPDALLPDLRPRRFLTTLTGEETSRRFPAAPAAPSAPRSLVKRTYELDDSVVQGIRRQALHLGVNANDLANALLAYGLQALKSGTLEATVGILPDEPRGPRAAGRAISRLQPHAAHPPLDLHPPESPDGEGADHA